MIVASAPTDPAWQPHADQFDAPLYCPATAPPPAAATVMSKSASDTSTLAGFLGYSLPVASLRSIWIGLQAPIGRALTPDVSVTVHGTGLPAGTVVVLNVSQPMGTPLLFPATTGTVIVDLNATPGTRAFAASDRAGYVAVIVADTPAEAGQAQADQALAPS